MSEHTPGPWTILHGVNVMAGRRSVANCGGHQSNTYDADPENSANARLIAAAPTMYEAICETLDMHAAYQSEAGEWMCECEECIRFRPIVEAINVKSRERQVKSDLLAALEKIAQGAPEQSALETGGRYDYGSDCGNVDDVAAKACAEFHCAIGIIARAAIAKAKGEG